MSGRVHLFTQCHEISDECGGNGGADELARFVCPIRTFAASPIQPWDYRDQQCIFFIAARG